MVESYRRRGALASRALGVVAGAADADADADAAAGVRLTERGPRGQIALRGDAANRRFRGAVAKVLGVEPPAAPNTSAVADGATVLWLGPDEWLAVLAPGEAPGAVADLEAALAGQHTLVSDVSHSRGVFTLAGARARDLLARGCSLDLHPRAFGPGRCAQSALARCHVLLHQLDDEPAFDLYVHRSFVEYAWDWLRDAGRGLDMRVASEA